MVSLDGVVQAPGAADEDPTGGFAHGGWHLRYFDDLSQTWVVETLTAAGGFLLGRRTYDGFAAHWPNPSEEQVVAEPLNIRPKYGPSTDQRLRHGWLQSSPVVDAFALPVPGQGPDRLAAGPADQAWRPDLLGCSVSTSSRRATRRTRLSTVVLARRARM